MLEPIEVARMEEHRQALGTSEIAPEWQPIAGGRMCAGEPGGWINQACALGLAGPVTDDEIERFIHFYESRQSEPKIEVCPFAHETLIKGLFDRGFRLKEFEVVFARELPANENLDALRPDVRLPDGRRVVIERIDPAAHDAEALCEINSRVGMSGFLPEGGAITEGMLEIGRQMLRHPRTILANVYAFDGEGIREPIAAYAMEAAPPVAAFFGVTVLEPYRRWGIQQLLIVDRLAHARDAGCQIACIHAKPGIPTERNALRLGFRLAYHKVTLTRPGEGLMASR